MAIVWEFFQPLLFGLIGAEVSIKYMESTLIGMSYNILCLHTGVLPTASFWSPLLKYCPMDIVQLCHRLRDALCNVTVKLND